MLKIFRNLSLSLACRAGFDITLAVGLPFVPGVILVIGKDDVGYLGTSRPLPCLDVERVVGEAVLAVRAFYHVHGLAATWAAVVTVSCTNRTAHHTLLLASQQAYAMNPMAALADAVKRSLSIIDMTRHESEHIAHIPAITVRNKLAPKLRTFMKVFDIICCSI